MKLARSFAYSFTLALVAQADAQVVTANSNSSTYVVDLSNGVSSTVGALGALGALGLATDESSQRLYIIANEPLETLYTWDYPSGGSVTPVGFLAPAGASGPSGTVSGLAFGNGRLYAMVSDGFTTGIPGIYEVDLQTAELSPVLPSLVGPFRAIAFDEATGLFYGPNSSLMELCVLNPGNQTITPIPGSRYDQFGLDFEGCSFANGRLYLVGAAVSRPGYVFDLATQSYVATFPNPITTNGAAGAGLVYSPTFGEDPTANYCTANANSTGATAVMGSSGSNRILVNDFVLEASSLPSFSFAFFIVSRDQGFVANPGGSAGNLCLSGAIGRYVGPGQVQQSGNAGTIALPIDLTAVPQPNGFVAALPGDRWSFQAWFRDSGPSGATSNFTDGLSVRFD